MQITRILKNPRTGRINVFVDGEYRLSVDEVLLIQEGLYVGKELDQKYIDNLVFNGTIQALFNKSLELISRRPRSEKELRTNLLRKLQKRMDVDKQNSQEMVELVISKLKEKKYLDEQEFVRWWIENRKLSMKRSNLELKKELLKKGIPTELIDRELKELLSKDEEISILRRAIAKKEKYYKIRTSSSEEYKDKMTKYLLRRGFSYNQIKQIL